VPLLVLVASEHIELAGWGTAVGLGLLFSHLPLAAELRQFQLLEKGWQGFSSAGRLGSSTQKFLIAAQLVFRNVELRQACKATWWSRP
jgi:hypothetical protein